MVLQKLNSIQEFHQGESIIKAVIADLVQRSPF